MSNDPFDSPASSSGIQWESLKGRLLAITPIAQEKDIKTVHGLKDAVRADVVVIDAEGGPVEYSDTLIFPSLLQANVRRNIGTNRPVLGRLGLGEKKPGQNAPWKLFEHSPEDKRAALEYWTSGKPSVPAQNSGSEPANAGAGGEAPPWRS